MSFEVIDNVFQLTVLFLCLCISLYHALRKREQILAAFVGVYGSFFIGSLYYTLHLIIIGETPHISYCAEISWLASFLFMLQIIILKVEPEEKSFSWKAAAAAILVMAFSWYNSMLGPFIVFVTCFTIIAGLTVYLSVRKIEVKREKGQRLSCVEICIPLIMVLDNLLYFVSLFYGDLTHFNLYFLVDFLITATLASVILLYLREEADA